jgi:hypothetical protein
MRIFLVLVMAFGVLTSAAWLRAPEYDEAYSLVLTAGDARPAWPTGIFHAGDVRGLYAGRASPGQIARDLRRGDVHPPLYFWALEYWRRLAGPSWFAARLLSVLFSLGALAAVGWLAALAELPVAPPMLLTLCSYGFAYTGIVARGFALAQFLNVLGVALVLAATRKRGGGGALAGGIALGAASFANYLASFTGIAVLAWLAANRRWRSMAAAAFGFLLFIPADMYFFLAQKSSRAGQFNAFSWPHALAALVKDSGAAVFGGLPVYAGRFGPALAVALGLLFCACLATALQRRHPQRLLFILAALAPLAGLLALGLIFNNMPIEIRYLAFSVPFLALLLSPLPRLPFLLLLAVQACGIIGLAFAPATMQPQGLAARAAAVPGALVLLPFGNDGVGIPGPFIAAAPNSMRILLLRPGAPPDLTAETNIILANIKIDAASRISASATLAQLRADPCLQERHTTQFIYKFKRICADSFHKD